MRQSMQGMRQSMQPICHAAQRMAGQRGLPRTVGRGLQMAMAVWIAVVVHSMYDLRMRSSGDDSR